MSIPAELSAEDPSQQVVQARRIRFAYPTGSLRRHYVEGDLVMSHVVAYLSAVFPEGEDFFVRSVGDSPRTHQPARQRPG